MTDLTLERSLRGIAERHLRERTFWPGHFMRTDMICSSEWGVDASLERIREMYAFGRLSFAQMESWVAVTLRHFGSGFPSAG